MFSSILLSIDLDDAASAARAAEAAVRLARSESAALHVLSVVPGPGMPIVGQQFEAGFEQAARSQVKAALDGWMAEHIPADLGATGHLAQGSIYDKIIQEADALGCDLIVMGAHRPELRDYLLGPNAARVVRHSRQSVFVVRDS